MEYRTIKEWNQDSPRSGMRHDSEWPSLRDACGRTRGALTGPWGPYSAWLTRRSQTTSGEQPRTISLPPGCRHNLLHRTLEIATTNKGLDAFLGRNVVNSVSYRCNSIRLSNDLPQPSLDPTATISRVTATTGTHHCSVLLRATKRTSVSSSRLPNARTTRCGENEYSPRGPREGLRHNAPGPPPTS